MLGFALVLSHEALAIYLPYFFAAIALQQKNVRDAFRFSLLPALSCLLAVTAVASHPGSLATARTVCASIGGVLQPFPFPDNSICGGSIQALPLTLTEAHQRTANFAHTHHYGLLYGLLAIPSLVPAVIALASLYRRDKTHREAAIISWCAAISTLGTSFLFYSSLDWGRWIHLHAFCLLLTILLAERLDPERVRSQPSLRYRWTARVALVLFAISWSLPFLGGGGNSDPYTGYFGRFRMFYRHHYSKLRPGNSSPTESN